MAYNARVLLDSVSPNGVRLITLEVTFPRFVLAEFNTHRQFCLDGETKLYFDLPTKANGSVTRRFVLSIREFYHKWYHGAAPRLNRRKTKKSAGIDPDREYTARELAAAVGYSDYTGIDLLTRRVGMARIITPGHPYRVKGLDFINWADNLGSNRQPMRWKLAKMELRSCNEDTGEIYHTRVRDVVFSGLKAVYRVKLKNGQTIVASKDHLFLTKDGWQSLEKAVGLSLSPGKIAAWERSAEFAVNGIEAYRDPTWLAGMRDAGLSVPRIAKYCGVSIHRVKYQCRRHGIKESDPQTVWLLSHTEAPWNKGRRYSNLTTRGKPGKGHVRKGAESHLWRGGTTPERKRIGAWTVGQAFRTHRRRLRKPFVPKKKRAMVRHFVELQSIEYAGERETYDLEVDGPYHNFVADGFIVHNSRNSASSRAVPTSKLIERVELDPVLPLEWGRNKAGMSASETLSTHEAADATHEWLRARDDAVRHAKALLDLKVHKQELNRILEPFLWHTVIVTSTEWKNFFELRCAPNAQPEIRRAALLMRAAMAESEPRAIGPDDWHTPLVQDDELELDVETRKRISAARCARVSYLTHEGKREIAKDLELYERLRSDRHLSPFEHVATPAGDNLFHANFRGWIQMRVEVERLGPVAAG